jgi:hypothetical protein
MVRLFNWTLALYPRGVREEFGEEMALVFAEQVADAERHDGIRGAARVWALAIKEVVTVALPNRLAPIAVPVIAAVASLIWFIGVLGLIPMAHR